MKNVKRIFFMDEDEKTSWPNLPHYELEDGTIMHPVFFYDGYGPANRMIWQSEEQIAKQKAEAEAEKNRPKNWIERFRNKFL